MQAIKATLTKEQFARLTTDEKIKFLFDVGINNMSILASQTDGEDHAFFTDQALSWQKVKEMVFMRFKELDQEAKIKSLPQVILTDKTSTENN